MTIGEMAILVEVSMIRVGYSAPVVLMVTVMGRLGRGGPLCRRVEVTPSVWGNDVNGVPVEIDAGNMRIILNWWYWGIIH